MSGYTDYTYFIPLVVSCMTLRIEVVIGFHLFHSHYDVIFHAIVGLRRRLSVHVEASGMTHSQSLTVLSSPQSRS